VHELVIIKTNYTDKHNKSEGLWQRYVTKPMHRFCKYRFD